MHLDGASFRTFLCAQKSTAATSRSRLTGLAKPRKRRRPDGCRMHLGGASLRTFLKFLSIPTIWPRWPRSFAKTASKCCFLTLGPHKEKYQKKVATTSRPRFKACVPR